MKHLLTILTICLTTVCYSQTVDDIEYFYKVKNDNDSTLKYFMSFLKEFDSTDLYKNFFCEKAAERVGDYYKSKKDYLRAIAYYDSADTKYRVFNFCGNAYYIDFIPRRYKVSQCYWELRKPKEALSTLTPHIFDGLGKEYFDSTMTDYYLTILNSLYTKQQIQNEIKTSVDQANYSITYRWSTDSTSKYPQISCKLNIFGSELELGGFEPGSGYEQNGEIPSYATKQGLIEQFKYLPIYERLKN
jgi:tetratricopeptide (TPR) repeat protein